MAVQSTKAKATVTVSIMFRLSFFSKILTLIETPALPMFVQLATKRPAGVAPEMNLMKMLHARDKTHKRDFETRSSKQGSKGPHKKD